MMLGSIFLMSTNSLSSTVFPNATLPKTKIWRRPTWKNLRKFTVNWRSIRRHRRRRRADLREALEDEPRTVFGDVETQLHVRALHLHLGWLRVEEQFGVRHFQEELRFVSDAGGQVAGGLR